MKRVCEQMPKGLDGCILQAMAPGGANTEESGVVKYVYVQAQMARRRMG